MPRLVDFVDKDEFDSSSNSERKISSFPNPRVVSELNSSFLERRRLVNDLLADQRDGLDFVVPQRADPILRPNLDEFDGDGILDWPRAEDNRRYSPVGRSDRRPSSLSGQVAKLQFSRLMNRGTWLPVFSSSALPCVDRHVRREVMFAKRKAGRGYRRRKRRSYYSNFRC